MESEVAKENPDRNSSLGAALKSIFICKLKTDRLFTSALLLTLVIGLVIRILLINHASWLPISDTRDYHDFARNLVQGNGYKQVYQGEMEVANGFVLYAFRPPGYPVFLVIIYTLFGWNHYAAFMANVLADILTQIFALLIALRLFGRQVALCTVFFLAIHVLWIPNLMTESVYTAFFTGITMLIVYSAPFRSMNRALTFGFITCFALFIRPITVSVFPATLLKSFRNGLSKRKVLVFILALMPTVLGLSLWSYRNYRLLGVPVLMSTNLGQHNADDFGINSWTAFGDYREQGLNEAQINNAFLQKEIEIALTHPFDTARLYVKRTLKLFSLRPVFEIKAILWEQTFKGPKGSELVNRLYKGSYLQYYIIYVLAAFGALLLASERRDLQGIWSILISFVVIHGFISVGNVRFAAPIYPILCLFASYLVSKIVMIANKG